MPDTALEKVGELPFETMLLVRIDEDGVVGVDEKPAVV